MNYYQSDITKGEWKVIFHPTQEDNPDFFVEAPNTKMKYGIEILGDDYGEHNGYPRKQRLADAKLIAAAPELLQAIEYYFDVLDEVRGESWRENPDHVLDKMLKAYQKAIN